jgi:hypothetical protein
MYEREGIKEREGIRVKNWMSRREGKRGLSLSASVLKD